MIYKCCLCLIFSYVFWLGDLNFRLDHSNLKSAEEIVRYIKNVKFEVLQKTANSLSDIWSQDELSSVLQESNAFKGFFESLPMFPPTYRYYVGSSHYDLKYVYFGIFYIFKIILNYCKKKQ